MHSIHSVLAPRLPRRKRIILNWQQSKPIQINFYANNQPVSHATWQQERMATRKAIVLHQKKMIALYCKFGASCLVGQTEARECWSKTDFRESTSFIQFHVWVELLEFVSKHEPIVLMIKSHAKTHNVCAAFILQINIERTNQRVFESAIAFLWLLVE